MTDYRITHTRPDGFDTDRRIDGFLINGHYYPIDQVIEWVRARVHRFYVHVIGRSVWVELKTHPANGRPYLTTQGDSFPPNTLLSLPNC